MTTYSSKVIPSIPADIRTKILAFKQTDVAKSSQQILQSGTKEQKQELAKKALLTLYKNFEDILVEIIALRFNLHEGQSKKLRFKKDRIRILKQHNIDYSKIDGFETAQVLALINQSITYEDAIVTHDLDNTFPFWKEGFPMVQLDRVYKLLAEDIQIHLSALIDALLND